MITRALYDRLHQLATLTRFNQNDAKELQLVIQKFINPKYSVCLKCVQQLKHGQKIILNYINSVQIIEDITNSVIEPTLLTEPLPDPIVDEEEAVKVGCSKCGRKKKVKN